MKVIFTVGVSGSGKSTWARGFVSQSTAEWVVIERDIARLEILKKNRTGYDLPYIDWSKWNWKWEKEVTQLVWERITECSKMGCNVIIADTNLSRDRIREMKTRLWELGYRDFEEKIFEIDFMEAVKRDAMRPASVGFNVIAKQIEQFDAIYKEQYKGSAGRPKTVLVDIDGTLAEMKDRGPFDWDKVGNDSVKEEVRDVVSGLQMQGYQVVVLSGRDGICYNETKTWLLQKAKLSNFHFFMRQAGDMRKDSIIKSEIFWENVAPNYDVKMVIDDRPQVTRMWRSIGLNVLQVGNPYVEF